jgi:hypothetical protein
VGGWFCGRGWPAQRLLQFAASWESEVSPRVKPTLVGV